MKHKNWKLTYSSAVVYTVLLIVKKHDHAKQDDSHFYLSFVCLIITEIKKNDFVMIIVFEIIQILIMLMQHTLITVLSG